MRVYKSKMIKSVTALGAALGLAGAMGIAASGTANAGNFGIELYLGNGSGIYYSGNRNRHRQYYNPGNYYPYYYQPRRYRRHHHRRNYYSYQPRRQFCGPRRAVNKAYRLGLNNPQVHRIMERRIVVIGYQYGYRTKMVFKRYSNCRLIKRVNFNW